MRFVPKGQKAAWQERAMAAADRAGLGQFISLCVKAKEWERLAQRVHSAHPAELEAFSHYCTEPAAKGLVKRDALAAARLYQALGMRIVNAGKSKYYGESLKHFEKGDFDAAEAGFRGTLELRPNDGPSQFFLKHLKAVRAHPPEGAWDGIIELAEK